MLRRRVFDKLALNSKIAFIEKEGTPCCSTNTLFYRFGGMCTVICKEFNVEKLLVIKSAAKSWRKKSRLSSEIDLYFGCICIADNLQPRHIYVFLRSFSAKHSSCLQYFSDDSGYRGIHF